MDRISTLITTDRKKFLHEVEMLHKRCKEEVDEKNYVYNMSSCDEINLSIATYFHRCTNHQLQYVEPTFRLVVKDKIIGGYAVINEELCSLWCTDEGKGGWLVQSAIYDGATRLECFDIPHLINLYNSKGFVETFREPNWTIGQPDVVYMKIERKFNPLK